MSTDAANFAWQDNLADDMRFRMRRREQSRRIGVVLMLSLIFGLTSVWIWGLVYSPPRTPVVAVFAHRYQEPLPPNAWSAENAARFSQLGAESLRMSDLTEVWETRERALESLEEELTDAARRSRGDAVIVYLSAHGAVDSYGAPALILPASSPYDSATWLPVGDVLDLMARTLPARTPKLLILDACRIETNWRLGMLHNTFAQRLEEAIDSEQHPRLAILNSTQPGQTAGVSRQFRGDAFTHFLQLGLSGVADQDASGGNGNRKVSLLELQTYLNEQLETWSVATQGRLQQCQLTPAAMDDFNLASSLNGRTLRKFTENQPLTPAARSVDAGTLDELWRQWEQVDQKLAARYAPGRRAQLEQQLLWLEQAAVAGEAYKKESQRLAEELKSQLADLLAATEGQNASAVDLRLAFTGARSRPTDGKILPSIPLARYFSVLNAGQAEAIRGSLEPASESPSATAIGEALASAAEIDQADRLCETQFLRLLQRHRTPDLWSNRDAIRRMLELRGIAEKTAALQDQQHAGDERILPWLKETLFIADAQRRSAEDAMLLGQETGLSGFEQSASAADASYHIVAERTQLSTEAYAVCDQAWAEAPYLGEWLARPRRKQSQLAPDPVSVQLIPLIRDARTLNTTISTPPDEQTSVPFLPLTANVRDALQNIREQFTDRSTDLLDTLNDANPDAVAEIDRLLRLPMLGWETRRDLRSRRDTMADTLHEASLASAKATESEAEDTDRDIVAAEKEEESPWEDSLQRIAGWERHPAIELLNYQTVDAEGQAAQVVLAENAAARVEQTGYNVRDLLRQRTDISPQPDAVSAEMTGGRTALAQLAADYRAAAPLLAAPLASSPVDALRMWDWTQLLLAQGERYLNDGWGPIRDRSSLVSLREDNYFFSEAWTLCLTKAQGLTPPPTEVQKQFDALADQATLLRIAARDGLHPHIANTLVLSRDEPVTFTGRLGSDTASAGAFSTGVAGVFIENRTKQVLAGPAPVSLPLNEPAPFTITGALLNGEDPQLVVSAKFRGHVDHRSFVVNEFGGVAATYTPNRYQGASVALFGNRDKRASLVFVLDCSLSMNEKIDVEAFGDGQLPRLDLAKSALGEMLDTLAQRDDVRVGVLFFGRRVAWTKPPPGRPTTRRVSPFLKSPAPDDLLPSVDVEEVLPLGRFTADEAGQVQRRLDSAEPWGQSPLYLALSKAMESLSREDPETEKSIIVITDGGDYQFTPSRSDLTAPRRATRADVTRLWDQVRAPVHILGFGVAAGDDATEEFQAIAAETQGSSSNVSHGQRLLDLLRSRLGVGSFSVAESGSPKSRQSVTLNRRAQVQPNGEPFEVAFDDIVKQIPLVPGDAVELEFTPTGTDIQAVPFDRGFPQAALLTQGAGGGDSDLLFRGHRPIVHVGGVRFPVSVQNQTAAYTPRPAEAWLSITPLTPGGREADYVFYDTNYEANQPTPVLSWNAANWPAAAKTARLRFWCKMQRTPPTRVIPLSQVLSADQSFSDFTALEEFPGAMVQVNLKSGANANGQYAIEVVDQHAGADGDIYQFKVEFRTDPAVRPVRVSHRFDAKNKVASHWYYFDPADRALIERSPESQIVLTSRELLVAGAKQISPDESVVVEIVDKAEYLPLEAATEDR